MHWVRAPLFWSFVSQTSAFTHFESDTGSKCSIEGDPDVYGIGIRIGLYLQWAAVSVATIFNPSQTRISRTTSNILIISVFINTFRTVSEDNLVALEWYIVTWLTFVLNVGNVPINLVRLHESTGSFAAMLLLWLCIIATQPWLYFIGVDSGRRIGCDVRVFFFGSISVYGKWREFGRAFSIIGLFCGLGALAAAVNVLLAGTVPPDLNDDNNNHRNTAVYVLSFIQFVTGTISILMVEMTIRTNNVDMESISLLDSGQLIPTLIGIFTLGSICFSSIRRKLRTSSDED